MLEDLATQGFVQPQQFLDLNGTIAVTYKLAKWHAATIFMNENVSFSIYFLLYYEIWTFYCRTKILIPMT